MRPGPSRCPGWPTGSSCSASTRIPGTASRRRWCGARRPGHPDVGAAVPGDLPDRRLPRPGCHRGPGQSRSGRSLTAEQVRYLITAKLLPLGIVAAEEAPAAAPKANPLLALRARGTLLSERAANAVGALLTPLFRWPVVVAVVVSIVVVDWWLFAVHGLGGGLQQVLRDPVDLLIVLGLSLVSAVFHECGHAAGVPLRRRVARQDRGRHLHGLARVLHQRHRLLPAVPGRAAAYRSRRPVL